MKKRTKEILSGVLAFSIALSTPAGLAAAESVGQQQDMQAGGENTAEHSLETISEVLPEHIAEDVSVNLSESCKENITEALLEEGSESITEALPDEIPEADTESRSELFTEDASDNLSDEMHGNTSQSCTEPISEKSSDDLYIESVEILESESDTVSENQSEIFSEDTSEETSEISSETESGQPLDSVPDSETKQPSENETESGQSTEIETESEHLSQSVTETESGQFSELETESGDSCETDLETASEENTEIENSKTESTETESMEIETEIETETTEAESTANEDFSDHSDDPIYIKELDINTAADTEETDINAPVLKELWVESAYHEAADTTSEQFLVKDFALKGTFCGKTSRVNKIEYTTDLQTADQSVWLEARNTQTAESKPSATGFQITLPDGAYPSIAIRAYDEAGNVSAVGQLVNGTGESIEVVVDGTDNTAEATQNQSAAKPVIKKTIKLKTTNPEVSKSETTTPAITNPESTNSENLNPETTNPENTNPEISKLENTNSENTNPEISNHPISKQEVPVTEVLDPEIIKPELVKTGDIESEIGKQETAESKETQRETTKSELTRPEVTKTDLTQKTLIQSEDFKFLCADTLLTDNVKPEINISFNDGNTASKNIYRQKRTATVRVYESNFDPDAVGISITKDSKPFEVLLSDWTSEGNEHYAAFELSEEGEYSIAASGVDLASQTETFIIDRIAPEMTVDLVPAGKTQADTNTAASGNADINNSFNTKVTAVIRVTEHNFREEDFTMNMTSVTEKGTWSHDGDVHTLQIPFDEDDAYHIECVYADLYGNSVKTVKKDFLIDTAAPTITIDGVGNNSSNNKAIRPVISVADFNLELSDISVCVTTGTGDLVQSAIDTELVSNENGTSYQLTLTDITEQPDNVYHLRVSACDKAGNVAERTYHFSLNRNGSVYDLTSLRQLVDQKYSTCNALNDIQIVEMNMDAVEEFDLYISRNGALGYKAEYTKEISGSADTGYTYLYQIKKENFAEEGIYRLTMYSRDRAGNEVNNATDINGNEITFVVDNTPPKVIIDGVESGKVYEVEAREVHVVIMDNFMLDEAELLLVNEANEVLERWDYIALAGEDGALDITIPQHDGKLSLLYKVKDATGNEIQTFQGDTAAPVGFIVDANKSVRVSLRFLLSFMTGVLLLTAVLLSVITIKNGKRKHRKESCS